MATDQRWIKDWGTPDQVQAAFLAGWDISSGPPPYQHALPPESTTTQDSGRPTQLGVALLHNGIQKTRTTKLYLNDVHPKAGLDRRGLIVPHNMGLEIPAAGVTVVGWGDVAPDEGNWNGWVEGPNNHNPWTEELGIGDAAYCAAFATRLPYHHGVRWPSDAQFGPNGIAYSPWIRQCAERHGWWMYDHASRGAPCDLIPGDIITQDWNGDGVDDHTETIWQVYADGTYDVLGANTGRPEGVHIIRRNRSYLVGRWRMQGSLYGVSAGPAPSPVPQPTPPPAPAPAPAHAPDGNPYTILVVDGEFGPLSTKAEQWKTGAAQDGDFGPDSKRHMQAHLGVTADGVIGPITVRALQMRVGSGVDGVWGPDTTGHLQGAMNRAAY